MMDARDLLGRLQNLNKSFEGIWPHGAILQCRNGCGWEQKATSKDCAYYLTHGWPKHCGRDVKVITLSAPTEQGAGDTK